MTRHLRILACSILVLICSLSVFADKKDYPLRVSIVETHWNSTPWGSRGYGRGDLYDGTSYRGFDYTFDCPSPFVASGGTVGYPARWKKNDTRLVILVTQIGNTSKHSECELKTTLANQVYAIKDGHLVTYSLAQAAQLQSLGQLLQQESHPLSTDHADYPIRASLLEARWEPGPAGGYIATGRGNVHDGASIIAFDFTALCPCRLATTSGENSYPAKWVEKGAKMTILSHSIGDKGTSQSCDLHTDMHPDIAYRRVAATGAVSVVIQAELQKMRQSGQLQQPATSSTVTPTAFDVTAPTVASHPALSNADVIKMVRDGLSLQVITAKIQTSQCAFETSAEALRLLKASNVPDEVVLEMIKKSQ